MKPIRSYKPPIPRHSSSMITTKLRQPTSPGPLLDLPPHVYPTSTNYSLISPPGLTSWNLCPLHPIPHIARPKSYRRRYLRSSNSSCKRACPPGDVNPRRYDGAVVPTFYI